MTYKYVSSSNNRIIPEDSLFAKQEEYAIVNIRGGVAFGSWNLDVFVNNASDTRAVMAENPRVWGTGTIVNRPRSVGLKLGKSF